MAKLKMVEKETAIFNDSKMGVNYNLIAEKYGINLITIQDIISKQCKISQIDKPRKIKRKKSKPRKPRIKITEKQRQQINNEVLR